MLEHPGAGDDAFRYDTLIKGCNPDEARYAFHVFDNGWPEDTFGEGTYWAPPALFEPASDDEVPAAPQTVIVELKPKRARKRR
ncbi:hypothetical protein ACFYMO_22230 [Streptomyces sp. NPDC007025]|uniref:hypothetical protein n=1 Tax=Streptomyces sp. NPDC007025 TaxID=3364771 RepID=UPI003678547F